jgi:SAM-dependent methyltransferase
MMAHPISETADIVTRFVDEHGDRFRGRPYFLGHCPVCGADTPFFCTADVASARETLICPACNTTGRYRSLALGLLDAISALAGVRVADLAALAHATPERPLSVYDTQVPFAYERAAYPLPRLLAAASWISVHTSRYEPTRPWGAPLDAPETGMSATNQTLEALAFPDAVFDVVVTSDVMEHVRLIDRAHAEIARVLRPGGVYLFTVPHTRTAERIVRVGVVDADDPARDVFLLEPEYHGDINGTANGSLSYRVFGIELDTELTDLGFEVEYRRVDRPDAGVVHTELFSCRRVSTS